VKTERNYSTKRADAEVMAITRQRLAMDEMAQLRAIAEFPGEVILAASDLRSLLDILQNLVVRERYAPPLSPDEEEALLDSARFAANHVKQRFAEVFGVPMVPEVKDPSAPPARPPTAAVPGETSHWDLY